MSLSSEFEKVMSKINIATDWCNKILNHEIAMENQNCWQCRYYNKSMSGTPTINNISGLTPTKTMIKPDFNSYSNWNWGDNYIGYMQCYVLCNKDYNLSTSFKTDDEGRLYCNGTSIATCASTKTANVTIPFKKGWNKVIIMFREGSGEDGAALLTKLSTQSFVDLMYANKSGDITEI